MGQKGKSERIESWEGLHLLLPEGATGKYEKECREPLVTKTSPPTAREGNGDRSPTATNSELANNLSELESGFSSPISSKDNTLILILWNPEQKT